MTAAATEHDLRAYYDAKALRLDELALTYESPIAYKRWFYRVRSEAVLNAFAAMPDERVLEIGCGTGFTTRAISETGAALTATDFSANYLAQAAAFAAGQGVTFVIADAQALPFRDTTFDAVLMSEVIEHLPDPDAALAEAFRVLRPGGRLVITTPSRRSPLNIAYSLKRRLHRYAFNEHLHEFSISEFVALVSGRFSIERVGFCNHLLPYPFDLLVMGSLARTLPAVALADRLLARTPILRRLGWTTLITARRGVLSRSRE